jgi:hypothetical protein
MFSDVWEYETAHRLGISLWMKNWSRNRGRCCCVHGHLRIREFISKKLLEEKGEKWWELCIKSEIRQKADDRKNAEKDVRWLTQRGNSMIYYTEFGDLLSIMGRPDNWKYFEVHIGNIDWAKQIITTLESRNIIMHSGELDPKDIERVGTYIRDWIRQVG